MAVSVDRVSLALLAQCWQRAQHHVGPEESSAGTVQELALMKEHTFGAQMNSMTHSLATERWGNNCWGRESKRSDCMCKDRGGRVGKDIDDQVQLMPQMCLQNVAGFDRVLCCLSQHAAEDTFHISCLICLVLGSDLNASQRLAVV